MKPDNNSTPTSFRKVSVHAYIYVGPVESEWVRWANLGCFQLLSCVDFISQIEDRANNNNSINTAQTCKEETPSSLLTTSNNKKAYHRDDDEVLARGKKSSKEAQQMHTQSDVRERAGEKKENIAPVLLTHIMLLLYIHEILFWTAMMLLFPWHAHFILFIKKLTFPSHPLYFFKCTPMMSVDFCTWANKQRFEVLLNSFFAVSVIDLLDLHLGVSKSWRRAKINILKLESFFWWHQTDVASPQTKRKIA